MTIYLRMDMFQVFLHTSLILEHNETRGGRIMNNKNEDDIQRTSFGMQLEWRRSNDER